MTAITPLESIHKKGVFGDHHKKMKEIYLRISEVKNLTIIQVVQYKNSKIDIRIKMDDLQFPIESSQVIKNKETRILWSGPRTWLIISSKENIMNIIKNV